MKSERPLSLGRGFFHALRRCKRSARPVLARLAESHQVGWKILRPDSESDAEGIAKLLLRERLDAAVFMKDDRSTGWFDGAEKASQETFRWKAIIVKSLPEFVLYHDELQLQLALGFQLGFQLNFKL